jgi:hypothetical protein
MRKLDIHYLQQAAPFAFSSDLDPVDFRLNKQASSVAVAERIRTCHSLPRRYRVAGTSLRSRRRLSPAASLAEETASQYPREAFIVFNLSYWEAALRI